MRLLTRQFTQPLFDGLVNLASRFIGGFVGGFGGGGGGGMAVTGGGGIGFAAQGAWFDGPASYFAKGGVFDKPTAFTFNGGKRLGVLAELDREAVLPLERGSDGVLGVRATGTSGAPSVNVQVNLIESPGNGGRVQQRQEDDGTLTLDIMVEQIEAKMNRNISRGSGLAPMLEGKYGLNPAMGAVR